jgi:hypothetical protein
MSKREESSRRQGGQRRRGATWSSSVPQHGPPHINPDARPHTSGHASHVPSYPAVLNDPSSTARHRIYVSPDEVPEWLRDRRIHPAPQYPPTTLYDRHSITGLPMPSSRSRTSTNPPRMPASDRVTAPESRFAKPPSPAERSMSDRPVNLDYLRASAPRLPPPGSSARGLQGPEGRNLGASRAPPREAYLIFRAFGGGEVAEVLHNGSDVKQGAELRPQAEGKDW